MTKTAAIHADLGGLGWFCHQYIQVGASQTLLFDTFSLT